MIEKEKWELPKVDGGNALKRICIEKTDKPDDRLLLYSWWCHRGPPDPKPGTLPTAVHLRRPPRLWPHSYWLIFFQAFKSDLCNFLHPFNTFGFETLLLMISIEVFSYFETICICKSFCMAASVYLNMHILKRICSAGCTLLYVATKYHVLSAHEQFI